MKKGFVIIVMMFLATSFVSAQAVKWYTWNEGYPKAKKEKRIIIIDVYTEWCGWCKVMDKKTYTNDDVIKKIGAKFIAIKVNPETDSNLSYDGVVYNGKDLIDKLSNNGISGYPTTIFFFPRTKKAFLEVGYKAPDAFNPALDKYGKMKY